MRGGVWILWWVPHRDTDLILPRWQRCSQEVGLLTPAGPQTPLISFSVHYSRKGLRRTGPGVNSSRWQGYQHASEYLRLPCALLIEGSPKTNWHRSQATWKLLTPKSSVRLSRTHGTIRDSSCCHFLTIMFHSSSPYRILPVSSLGVGFGVRT